MKQRHDKRHTLARATAQTGRPYAVVIGLDDGTTGIQTARLLARRRVPVIALARDPGHYCCRTRVCERIVYADTRTDALVGALERVGAILPERAVLFPCQDENVLVVSRHRDRLAAWYHIVLPPPDVVETMIDKSRFYAFAAAHDLPIPRTFILRDLADAQAAAEELTYPCIVKPENRPPAWTAHTHAKAFLAQDGAELMALYQRCRSWTPALIAQEWIVGDDGDHYAFNGYFDAAGQPTGSIISRKIRQWPPRTGQGCLSEPCANDAVTDIARRLFAAATFRGLGYVEVKRDVQRDAYFIIEPNIGRPTGRSTTAEANGVELVYAMYCEALGRPLDITPARPRRPVKWIHWRRDLLSAFYYWRRGELSLRDWWASWRGPKVSAIFSWGDPLPFVADLWRSLLLLIKPDERQVRPGQESLSSV